MEKFIAAVVQASPVLGVIERDIGTLYCTVLYFSAEGRYSSVATRRVRAGFGRPC